jgi:hypothetical protein
MKEQIIGMKKQLKLSSFHFAILILFFSCGEVEDEGLKLSKTNEKLNSQLKEVIERNKDGDKIIKYYIDNDSILQGELEHYYKNGSLKRKEFYINGIINGWASEYTEGGKLKSKIAYRFIEEKNIFDLNEVQFFDENQNLDINKSIEVRLLGEVNNSFKYGSLPIQTDSIHCFFFNKGFLVIDSLFKIGNTVLIKKEYEKKIALFELYQSDKSGVVSLFSIYKLIGAPENNTLRTPDL